MRRAMDTARTLRQFRPMKLSPIIITILSAGVLSACASAPSPYDIIGEPDPLHHQISEAEFSHLKSRLIRTGANLMRANARVCAKTRTIETPSESFEICANKVGIERSRVKNAHTNGQTILVTTAMIAALDDDELAFIIAHELAHSTQGHDMMKGSLPALELDADYAAVFLMDAASYNLKGASRALSVLGMSQRAATDSHPAGADRLAAIGRAAQAIYHGAIMVE
ncbi:MAG: M48 family metalloprotease [Robiginitomaculum sp.]